MGRYFLIGAAVLAAGLSSAANAVTVIEPPNHTTNHTCDAITFTGVTVDQCAGGFTGNLIKGSVAVPQLDDPGLAALQALGYVGDGSYLELFGSAPDAHVIDFATLLKGITYVGIHYGAGAVGGGQNNTGTSFFKLNAGTGTDTFNFVNEGISNYALFGTERGGGSNPPPDGVPEPTTWAMMILGFGVIGVTMRRRQRRTVRYDFA